MFACLEHIHHTETTTIVSCRASVLMALCRYKFGLLKLQLQVIDKIFHAVQCLVVIFCLLSSNPKLCKLGKQQYCDLHNLSFLFLGSPLDVTVLLQKEMALKQNGVPFNCLGGRSVLVVCRLILLLASTSAAIGSLPSCSTSKVSRKSSRSFFLPVGEGSELVSGLLSMYMEFTNRGVNGALDWWIGVLPWEGVNSPLTLKKSSSQSESSHAHESK